MNQRQQVSAFHSPQPIAHAGSSLADFLYNEVVEDTFLRNVG
jgi:hypothetical protein